MEGREVVFVGRGEVSIERFAVRPPQAHEVLVETITSVISPGTERAFLLAEPNTATRAGTFPFYPGYSNIGRVVDVGHAVRNVQIGTLLATMTPHRSHATVRAPLDHPRQSGGGAIFDDTEVTAMSWRLREPASADQAAFIMAGVALYGVRLAHIGLGDQVVVAGLGPIGLFAGQMARCSGALPVTGIARTATLREAAQAVGFDETFATIEALTQARPDAGRAGRTVVIEATGRPDNVRDTLAACPEGATLILLGSTRGTVPDVDFYSLVHRKALTIIGAHQPTRAVANYLERRHQQYWDADTALRMIGSGRIDARRTIGARFEVERLRDAYALLCGSRQSLAIALDWTARSDGRAGHATAPFELEHGSYSDGPNR